MKFKSERTFDMSQFGWTDCKFVFNAITWGEQKDLDKWRIKWQSIKQDESEEAANKIVDILKSKFVRGEALDESGNKTSVSKDDFESIPFDIFLKLIEWVTTGDVDNSFLDSSTKLSTTTPQ